MKEVAELSKVSLAGYGWLSFSVLALNYLSVFHPRLWRVIFSEDGLVEYLQVGFFFLSSIGLFMAAFASRNTWRWLAFLFAGLVMVFVAGEEISWGQRIFGFESPDWFKAANHQGETNFHNLMVDRGGRIQVVLVFICAYISFLGLGSNKFRLFGIPCPSMPLACCLLIAISYRSGLLPGSHMDVLVNFIASIVFLIFLPAYIVFRHFSYRDKGLISIGCATIALILSSEYFVYIQNYVIPTSVLHPHDFTVLLNEEINEYILSFVCLFYSVELLSHSRRATELTSQQPIAKARWTSGGGGWLLVCSVVTVCSIGLVPAVQLYTAHTKDAIEDRFYSEVRPSGPVALSVFDVYAAEDQLIYHKQPCAPADIENTFFLYVISDEERDLPEVRRSTGAHPYYFDIVGFIGDSCIHSVDLPDYEIASISTGQFTDEEQVWAVEFPFPPVSIKEEFDRLYSEIALSVPVALSVFDVYATEDQLIYHKQPCAPADIENTFFLHVIPVEERDLSEDGRSLGFDNYHFHFPGLIIDSCMRSVDLPDYEIASISTGQFTDEEQVWAVEILFPPVSIGEELARFYSEVAPSGPVALSVFDVYATEDQLIYHKQPCALADIESDFFLHVIPVEVQDLPEDRQSLGFDNYDFRINGTTLDDSCVKTVDLPDYKIAGIRTGQFTDEEQVWAVEIPFPTRVAVGGPESTGEAR